MASLVEKLKKNTTLKHTEVLSESKIFNDNDYTTTPVPMLNIALSGDIDKGFTSGLISIAGESKRFKTGYALLMASSYLKKYPESVILFYDSEFGSPEKYFESFEIDLTRVIHTPITNVEELKFDLIHQLDNLSRGEKVFVLIDSLGNLASKKELDDAKDQKSVADMSRAKSFKSLFRMVTPKIKMLDIPCVAISHVYKTLEMFSKDVMSGGCVVAGTKIRMKDNSLKNIENIQVGDYVKTLSGYNEVEYTWNPDTLENGTPECYELEFEDGYKVTVSDQHKFLVSVGDTFNWVKAMDLTGDMDIVVG